MVDFPHLCYYVDLPQGTYNWGNPAISCLLQKHKLQRRPWTGWPSWHQSSSERPGASGPKRRFQGAPQGIDRHWGITIHQGFYVYHVHSFERWIWWIFMSWILGIRGDMSWMGLNPMNKWWKYDTSSHYAFWSDKWLGFTIHQAA